MEKEKDTTTRTCRDNLLSPRLFVAPLLDFSIYATPHINRPYKTVSQDWYTSAR